MAIHLEYKQQFKEVLGKYQPSSHAKKVLNNVELVAMMGLSGSGRNTIINELVKTGKYHFVISDTTRPPRKNNGIMEQDGVEYFFRSEKDFLEDLQNGEFLEAAIIHDQQVSGISIRELENATDSKEIAVADIQNDGVEAVLRVKPDALCIFILPPDFQTWQTRLGLRGEMSDIEKRRRLESSLVELEAIRTVPYAVIVNDDLDGAVQKVRNAIEKDEILPFENSKADLVVAELISGIQSSLALL